MTPLNLILESYIAAWNETDPIARAALVADSFAEDASYVDPLMAGEGHGGISAMIGAAQAQFPGLRFRLAGTPDSHHDRARFAWCLGAPVADAAPVACGSDFALLAADGRLRQVTGFLDQV